MAEIERDHEDAVRLVFARQEGRIIDFRVAQVDIFEGPADVHAFVPLVLSANGIADLPVHRQIGRPVAVRDGRGIVGDALPLLKTCSGARFPGFCGNRSFEASRPGFPNSGSWRELRDRLRWMAARGDLAFERMRFRERTAHSRRPGRSVASFFE